ncbi:MAG TPA: hypothetical protein VKQ08_00970, partial [Cyclobacteriaceae bacterium]|nr:hypothetical protein [Cyclobacteriaceae bacterium]
MPDETELYKLELDKLFTTMNSIQDLRLRVGIFIGTANLTGIGIGLTSSKPIIIILSACLMLLFV